MNTDALLLYYIGLGIPLVLVWACFADLVSDPPSATVRSRYRRVANALAFLGVLHPGFALTGLDMARQLARPSWEAERGAFAAVRNATWGVGISAVVTAAFVIGMSQ